MSGTSGCRTIVALLPDGITPVFCMLAGGHDKPHDDPGRCGRCGNVVGIHVVLSHPFESGVRAGSPHVAHVRRDA